MSAHSPLPWAVKRFAPGDEWMVDPGRCDGVYDADGDPVISTDSGVYSPNLVTADFIVRAVNCHDDLLAALKSTLDWLSSFSMPPAATIAEKQDHMAILEAAIAKAEAE